MEADEVLVEALGALLAGSYLSVKRSEYAAFSTHGSAFEHKMHFWKY